MAEQSDFGDPERPIQFDRENKTPSTPIGDELLTLRNPSDEHLVSPDPEKIWRPLNMSIFQTPGSSGGDRTGSNGGRESFGNIEPPMVHHSLFSKQGLGLVRLEPVIEEKNTLEKGTDFGYDNTPLSDNEFSEVKSSPRPRMNQSLDDLSFFGSECNRKFLKGKKSQSQNPRKAAKQRRKK
jgi:hypothetical protein